jgi:hypothetical protein
VSAAAERLRELERSVEAAQQVINDDMKIINDIKTAINEMTAPSAVGSGDRLGVRQFANR